jgi:hypothetical protein
MNRKDFFKRLFGAAAVAVVAPSVLGKEETFQDIVDADHGGNVYGRWEVPLQTVEVDLAKIPQDISFQDQINFFNVTGYIAINSFEEKYI